jgi:precorrin-6B methylase 2
VVKLQSLLAAVAVATAALFLLMGALTMWDNGSGSGSIGVDILWWLVWIVYTLAKVALAVVALAAGMAALRAPSAGA